MLSDHEQKAFDELVAGLRGDGARAVRGLRPEQRGIRSGVVTFLLSMVGVIWSFTWSTPLALVFCATAYLGLWLVVEAAAPRVIPG